MTGHDTEPATARAAEIAAQIRLHVELALLQPLDELESLAAALERQEAILPVIDPTRYRDTLNEREHARRLLAIHLRYRRELEDLAGMGIGRRSLDD